MMLPLRASLLAWAMPWSGLLAAGQKELPHGITMRGQPVDEPERWSGVWEQEGRNGGAVGMTMELTTTIRGAATTLRGVVQYENSLQVGVFERHGPDIQFGDASYFTDDAGSVLQWKGKRLHISFNERADDRLDDRTTVIVDVGYDGRLRQWTGYMRRRDFSGPVTLRRPHVERGARASAMVGTWANTDSANRGCVHIVQHRNGTLAGWSDLLQTPGLERYGNGLKPPEMSYERYGQGVKVAQVGADLFSIEFNAFSGICCSRTMYARVRGKTVQFLGEGPHGGVEWKKTTGGTCRNETPPRPKPVKPCTQP